MTFTLQEHMNRAIALASQALHHTDCGPFGAIVVHSTTNTIVSQTHNQVVRTNDPTAHAEMCAIRQACQHLGSFNLRGYSIVTSCEPCPMCLGAIYWAHLDHIYFAATAEDAKNIGFDDAHIATMMHTPAAQRLIPSTQCLQDQAAALMHQWQQNAANTRY